MTAIMSISTKDPSVTLTVADVSGKVILARQLNVTDNLLNTTLDLGNSPSGLYLMTLQGATSRSNYKLIKM